MQPASDLEPLSAAVLPTGVRARVVEGVADLRVHLLEAGDPRDPLVLLVHGFPELAFSWRRVLPGLAAAGYHAVAPDLRGYGRTTGWGAGYDEPLAPFRPTALVRDLEALVRALGRRSADAVVGHDVGSHVAACCALTRPDVFPAVALLSAPFGGAPPVRVGEARPTGDVHADLLALPRPRVHYQWYYATRQANDDLLQAPEGLHAFLRAYFHVKSADWPGNEPHPLAGWTAGELARLPTYYVMDAGETMPSTVAPHLPDAASVAANRWLPDADLAVYVDEYARTGFQGGLQWYRVRTTGLWDADLAPFAGRTIDVPALFVGGASDWGVHQAPGALERMRRSACTDLRGVHLLEGAGHWVQQERADETTRLLAAFLATVG
ncbi:MAG: alpha/beta fold hydrolase [Thermoleophilia bacterium]